MVIRWNLDCTLRAYPTLHCDIYVFDKEIQNQRSSLALSRSGLVVQLIICQLTLNLIPKNTNTKPCPATVRLFLTIFEQQSNELSMGTDDYPEI